MRIVSKDVSFFCSIHEYRLRVTKELNQTVWFSQTNTVKQERVKELGLESSYPQRLWNMNWERKKGKTLKLFNNSKKVKKKISILFVLIVSMTTGEGAAWG